MRRSGWLSMNMKRLQVIGHHLKPNIFMKNAKALHHAVAPKVNLSVSKSKVMIDEKVQILAKGLRPGQKVTLQAYMEESDREYGSCGHYIADDSGTVDTYKHASIGGTFDGLKEMGLFWSMQSRPGIERRRLVKANVMTPYDVTLALHDGFRPFEDLPWSDIKRSCLSSSQLLRSYAGPGVRRIPIEQDGLYGTLFLPPGDAPFPAVIDLFGLTSEIIEFRSALLASHGIASFVITYVGHKDLPKSYLDIDYNYHLKAFDFLASHPLVDKNSLGGIATCGGAMGLQIIASKRPLMKCLVSVNGALFTAGTTQTVEGEIIQAMAFDFSRATFTDDGRVIMRSLYDKELGILCVTGWRNGAKVLFLQGLDDQCVNPNMLKDLEAGVSEEDRKNMSFLYYPGTGHLLEPPYTPHSWSNYNPYLKRYLVWGGEPGLHAEAQADSWPKVIDFFSRNLKGHAHADIGSSKQSSI